MSQRQTSIPIHHVMHVEYGNKALLLLLLLFSNRHISIIRPNHCQPKRVDEGYMRHDYFTLNTYLQHSYKHTEL